MSDERSGYDIQAIRELLHAAFTAEDLRRFCLDRPSFAAVVDRFGRGQGLDDVVDEVIDYCRTQLLWDELLVGVREDRSNWYAAYQSKIGGGGAKQQAVAQSDIAVAIRLEDRRKWSRAPDRFRGRKQVDVLGWTLSEVCNHPAEIAQEVKNGCGFRFLLMDPSLAALDCVYDRVSRSELVEQIEVATGCLRRAARGSGTQIPGPIDYRFLPVVPAYSMMILDPLYEETGRVQVELFLYGVPGTERPHFVLKHPGGGRPDYRYVQPGEKQWYWSFVDQFDTLWELAKPPGSEP